MPDLPTRRAALVAPAGLLPGAARAFDGTTQPVRLVVPYTPAGQTDMISRLLAQRLSQDWGRPVLVENRPGGNALIGAEAVVRAPPDGATLLSVTLTHAINASLFPQAPYDFLRDLQTLTLLGALPLVVVVRTESPWQSLPELAATAAAHRPLNGGSSGTGTPPHLALELFRRATGAGASLQHVPYRGGAPSVTDLVGGTLDLLVGNLPECLGQIRAGRLRALAVTSPARHRLLPAVPSVAEAGLPGLTMTSWTAIQAPAGVPGPLAETIAAAIRQAMTDPVVAGKATELGFDVIAADVETSRRFIAAEVARYGQIIAEAQIRPD